MGGTHIGAVCEELKPVERAPVGEAPGGLSHMGRSPLWSRGRV